MAKLKFTDKQQKFINEYLKCWNATEAARRAGYAFPNVMGTKLVKGSEEVAAEIARRIEENAMSANEVLARLGDIARGDLGDFLSIGGMSFDLSLKQAQDMGITHLIKKVRQKTVYTRSEER